MSDFRDTRVDPELRAVLGKRITDARNACGINRNELARRLGTSWALINRWEKGSRRRAPHRYVASRPRSRFPPISCWLPPPTQPRDQSVTLPRSRSSSASTLRAISRERRKTGFEEHQQRVGRCPPRATPDSSPPSGRCRPNSRETPRFIGRSQPRRHPAKNSSCDANALGKL